MGDYQGSQAFAQTHGSSESITRNTGSLNYSVPLVELRGVVKAIDLTVVLTYTSGIDGNFGLPQNWTFGIPYVIPKSSVTTQGRTYVIDFDWGDANGYQSGLRYINNHGMLFSDHNSPLGLPSGNPGEYRWTLRYTDGAVDYFDQVGKLLEHDDIHGNYIYYSYVDSNAGPRTASLDYIQDSWGQKITFGYEPGSAVYVTGPNNDQITISYSPQGVSQVQFPVDITTSFEYIQVASRFVLSRIEQSAGLQSVFNYQTLNYLDSNNQTQRLPAVQDHYHLDANGKYLSQTTYQFGTASSGNTFTGYAAGFQMGANSDALMDNGSTAYEYDTLVLNVDADNKLISASRVTYNYLHLPIVEDHYAIDALGHTADTFRAVNTYSIDPNLHARTPNYSAPVQVEHCNWNPASQIWQKLRQANSVSDDYGCVTYSDQSLWDAQQGAYVLQQSTKSTYVPVSWGGQMLSSEVYSDALTGYSKQLTYTLTSDQKDVATRTTSYQTTQGAQMANWKIKSSTYDGQGRIISDTVAWVDASSAPTGSIESYTNSNEYSYDSGNGYFVLTAIDPQGKRTTSKYAVKIRKGPLVEKQLPLGQKESFTYDILGRQLSHIDPLNDATLMTYTVSPTENSVSSVTSNGYRLKYVLDCLGRHVRLLDNGDSSTASPSAPTRIVYIKTYDSLSRLTSKTDGVGLTTYYNSYDAFNRVLSITDPDGNAIVNTYDDVKLQLTNSVNGSLRVQTQLDGFNRKVSASKYADSSDSSIGYYLTETFNYNGLGKVNKTEHHQNMLSQQGGTLLDTTTITFDVEDNVQTEVVTTKSDVGDNTYDTAQRTFVHDIFGLVYTHVKTLTYSDGRSFVHPGTVQLRDDCSQLVQQQNQIGQLEKHAYNDNGWKIGLTRFDGDEIQYQYDDLGRLLTAQDSVELETRSYLTNGRLSDLSVKVLGSPTTDSVTYSYSLDGSATGVTYPGNLINAYGLDNVGRIISQTDVNGVQRHISFDPQDRIASRSIGNDTVTYTYGVANHTNGQLLEDVTTGAVAQQRTIQYDGYGRASKVVVTNRNTSVVLLSSQYRYNAQNKLQLITLNSQTSASEQLNLTKTFLYDGFGQLVSETTSYSGDKKDIVSYVYDGNCNITSRTQNGVTETRTYNAIGQRTDPGFTYDANGRLLTDHAGRTYKYLANDRLLAVGDASFEYHPDGSLASVSNPTSTSSFYYDNGTINTANKGKDIVSYQLEPGRRLAAYDNSSNTSTYFLENNGSTVLTITPTATAADDYGAYGNPTDGSAPDDVFGFRQEYAEPSSGLVYLRSRFYQPDLATFITMDPTQKENRYVYCGGDPINRQDMTGHSGAGAAVAGIAASVVTTAILGVATGGLAAAVFGPEAIAASVTATAISGAAGNVTGDVVSSAAAHQQINGERLGIDALAGAVGGAVGAGSGGAAGQLAMRIAEPSVQAVENVGKIGSAVSGVVGGVTGSISSGLVDDLGEHRSPFSGQNALSLVTGALAGLGGGILTSMSYLPFTRLRILPIPLSEKDFPNMHIDTWHETGDSTSGKVLKSFVDPAEHARDLKAFRRGGRVPNDILRLNHGAGNDTYDTFVVHGQGADVFPAMNRTVNGEHQIVLRPMKGTLFAKKLFQMQQVGEFGINGKVKALSCYAALFNAKSVAKALQTNVFGSWKAISGTEPHINWRER